MEKYLERRVGFGASCDYASESEKLAHEHWAYIRQLLNQHIEQVGFHYRTAFEHGFKHGVEHEKRQRDTDG